MRPVIRADAATIRAWAQATGRQVGSRGAISTQLQNQYVTALALSQLRRAGLAAGRLAVAVAPSVVRAVSNRDTAPQQREPEK